MTKERKRKRLYGTMPRKSLKLERNEVFRDLLVHPVLQDIQDIPVHLAHKGPQGLKVLLEARAPLVHPVGTVGMQLLSLMLVTFVPNRKCRLVVQSLFAGGARTVQKLLTYCIVGIAGGSRHRDLPGGGANLLCLPSSPSFVNPVDGVGDARAFLYSVQYQISNYPAWQTYHLQDVSCAVCKATGRYSHLMIPAMQSCPSSEWTLEYRGYLMAERSHTVHHKSMFICMDQEPQPVPNSGGAATASSALLNLVEGKCSTSGGGLPCGQYPDGKEFTCAVCTL
ncbi:hypothetical protein HOLleu_07438 [Holothuria leucospilota]|uniref:Uncharacterized protein n=1 Tax=Holothuria leucospilota TaxID=206669 RepID=A0A9Q1CG52_HOLLE|nr:hypothetical protein HOLleu_07438 [Holothuria leucospilota]